MDFYFNTISSSLTPFHATQLFSYFYIPFIVSFQYPLLALVFLSLSLPHTSGCHIYLCSFLCQSVLFDILILSLISPLFLLLVSALLSSYILSHLHLMMHPFFLFSLPTTHFTTVQEQTFHLPPQ